MTSSQSEYKLEDGIRSQSNLDHLQAQLDLHPLSQRHLSNLAPKGTSRLVSAYKPDGSLAAFAIGLRDETVTKTFGPETMLFHDFLALNEQPAVDMVFDVLKGWGRSLGAQTLVGPMSTDLSALRGVRLGESTLTTALGLPDNPGYFSTLLEATGLEMAQDLFSLRISTKPNTRAARLAEYVRLRHPDFYIRTFELDHIERELEHVVRIYNNSWAGHWGFIPLTKAGIYSAFEGLRPYFEEKLAFFVMIDGVEQGVAIGIPNPVPLDFDDPKKSVRGMLFGVSKRYQKRGIDALLIDHALQTCASNGFTEAEIGWVLESNSRWLSQIRKIFKDQILGENHFRLYRSKC